MDRVLYICYNNNCPDFPKAIIEYCKQIGIEVICYNENYYKERAKAFRIKGGYSARMAPFMLLERSGKYERAFYSENGGCTLDALKCYLENNG